MTETLGERYRKAKAIHDESKFMKLDLFLDNYRIKFEETLNEFLSSDGTTYLPPLYLEFDYLEGLWSYWKQETIIRHNFLEWANSNGFAIRECEEDLANGQLGHFHMEVTG